MSWELPITVKIALDVAAYQQVENALNTVTDKLSEISKLSGTLPRVFLPSAKQIATTGKVTAEEFRELERAMRDLTSGGKRVGDEFSRFWATLHEGDRPIKFTRYQALQLREVFNALGEESARKLAMHFDQVNKRVAQAANLQREYLGYIGATGVSINSLARTVFWSGLGFMFMTMSLSRVSSRTYAYERQVRSLREALIAEQRARERLTWTLFEYGAGTEQAVSASDALRRAHNRVVDAEEALRQAELQRMYTTTMLYLGFLPTAIRLSSDLTRSLWTLSFSEQAVTTQEMVGNAVREQVSLSMILNKIRTDALTLSYLKLQAVIAGATIGLSLLISYLAQEWAYRRAEERIAKVREELEGFSGELLGSHSPSLLEAVKEFNVEIGRSRIAFASTRTSIGQINLYASVRSEGDIYRIREQLESIVMGVKRRGGLA